MQDLNDNLERLLVEQSRTDQGFAGFGLKWFLFKICAQIINGEFFDQGQSVALRIMVISVE